MGARLLLEPLKPPSTARGAPPPPQGAPREEPPHSPKRAGPKIDGFSDSSNVCGEENFPVASNARAGPAADKWMTTLLSRGNMVSRGFSGFVTFQGFAGRKIFLSLRRPPNSPAAARAAAGRGGAAPPGRGGKMGPAEAVIAVEFAVELEQPIHRPQIALHHHSMWHAGDLKLN